MTTTYPDNKTVVNAYDGLGLVTIVTDPENRTTTSQYDKASQLLSVTNALNQMTQYAYDLAGNKTSQIDANNHTTTYGYDGLNRRISRALPTGLTETYSYDAVGNLLTRQNLNGKTTTYVYDARNRVMSITPDPSIGGTAISFTYTPTGKRATMMDQSGLTTYTYDNRDRVLSKATPQGTLTYAYNPAGNAASVVSSNANGVNLGYAYDTLNRLATVTDNSLASTQTTYAYDNVSNLSAVTYPSGVAHAYGYDPKNQLTSLTVNNGASVLGSYAYTYGFAGEKMTANEQNGRATSFGYDIVYKLLSETIASDPAPANNGTIGYSDDAVGNRLTRSSTVAAIPPSSATYDTNDRISSDTFDNNGNTLTGGTNSYSYDFRDELTSANGGAVTMVYDGDGNRVAKTVGGVTTGYLIDDNNPTGYAQVVEELTGGAVQRRYTHGRSRIGQTQLISSAWVTSYYGYDGGGSVRQLFDNTGAVTDSYVYDAFGNTVASTGTTPNAYLYRGEQYDASLQLYYLRARWMNPQSGRFITADTYEGEDEEPASLHKYLYAGADAVNRVDPSGMADLVEEAEGAEIGGAAEQVALRPNTSTAGITLGKVKEAAQIAASRACGCCLPPRSTNASAKSGSITRRGASPPRSKVR
jgi:RHS repeat-associated protein